MSPVGLYESNVAILESRQRTAALGTTAYAFSTDQAASFSLACREIERDLFVFGNLTPADQLERFVLEPAVGIAAVRDTNFLSRFYADALHGGVLVQHKVIRRLFGFFRRNFGSGLCETRVIRDAEDDLSSTNRNLREQAVLLRANLVT